MKRQAVSCAWVREHLPEILAATISREDRNRLTDHLDACEACAEMLSEAMFTDGDDPQNASEASLRRILAATSGSPCADALERIVSIETAITASDELLTGHLDHCPLCRRKAEAWEWVRTELAAMAELEAPASLVAAVLDRTSRAMREAGWREWIREHAKAFGESLVRRPRAALELGYLFALPFVLLFNPSAFPGQLLENQMIEVSELTTVAQDEAVRAAAGLGRTIEDRVRPWRIRISDGWTGSVEAVDQFYREIGDVAGMVKSEMTNAVTACSAGSFDRGIRHAGTAWNAIMSFDPGTESKDSTEGKENGTE